MDSVPEFDVHPERDRHSVPTGRFVWEVYDAATGGPIKSGVEFSKEHAHAAGKSVLKSVESSGLYCSDCSGYKELGIDACLGCCGRR